MAQDELRRAIQLMQDGGVEEAATRLQRLVAAPSLDAKGRAAAYVWLAEAADKREEKRRCLERALEYDPDNRQIKQGLNSLLAQPASLPQMRRSGASVLRLDGTLQRAQILGGRNGSASGVFLSQDGLLATTSYALGGAETARLRLDGEGEITAAVARRFPLYDLAFIQAPVELERLPAVVPRSMIMPNMAFVAHCAAGARLRGVLTLAPGNLPQHWLGASIPPAQISDAGGAPLLDERGQLLGILTRNIGADGGALALAAWQALALAGQFQRDRQLMPGAGYCRNCGGLARALAFGGLSCEVCGARIGSGQTREAQAEQLAQLYGDQAAAPCQHCGARVPSYGGRCLRCGQSAARRKAS